jgi:hypothetical protein
MNKPNINKMGDHTTSRHNDLQRIQKAIQFATENPSVVFLYKSVKGPSQPTSATFSLGAGVDNIEATLLDPMLERFGFGKSSICATNTNGMSITFYDVGIPKQYEDVACVPKRSIMRDVWFVIFLAIVVYVSMMYASLIN